MSDVKKSEETKVEAPVSSEAPAAEVKSEAAPAPEASAEAPVVEAPKPKLAAGLFQGFTLGSTLAQGPQGNTVTNMKKPAMDYEKVYQQSTKNQQMSPEQIQELSKPKK